MKYVKVLLPIFFLLTIELLLFLTNFKPHTSLYGWDTILPELNFGQNFLSQIFGVWQQNKALGFYDGMVTMSNVPHTIFLWLLSFLLPTSFLRYFFIFLMHFLGIVGMYLLIQKLLKKTWIAIAAALFYGLNFATIQMFYAPLEVFAVHFASLPFLTFTLISFLQEPRKKTLVGFALVSVISLPQAFVPQVFISYLLLLLSILTTYLWVRKKEGIRPVLMVLLTVFCINAYWMLPYVYGIPQNAPVILNSEINQSASTSIYLMNHARGDLWDTIFLKGFMLDTTEFIPQKGQTYIMQVWRSYTSSPFFLIPSLFFALLCFLGIFQTIKNRQKGFYPFLLVFFVCFFFLGNNIFGLSMLNGFLRFFLPVFNEAFRFPFTKFSTLFVFTYSIFLGYGIYTLTKIGQIKLLQGVAGGKESQRSAAIGTYWNHLASMFGKELLTGPRIFSSKTSAYSQLPGKLKVTIPKSIRKMVKQCQNEGIHFLQFAFRAKKMSQVSPPEKRKISSEKIDQLASCKTKKMLFLHGNIITPLFSLLTILLIFLSSLPAFQGNFLYSMLRLPFPKDYKETISFFQKQNPNARISILPEASFWNWQYHTDGYRGSGFLWYGLPQAVMERSFDPWSSASEEYYWELSQAIYSQNPSLLKSVFEKYQISYALLDLKKMYPYAPQSAQIPETEKLLKEAGLTQIQQFGDEHIYFFPNQAMVSVATHLPKVEPFAWTQKDMFYFLHGPYISSSSPEFSLPFSSLFTLKKNPKFSLSQDQNFLIFTSILPKNMSHLLIPSYAQIEQFIPATLTLQKQKDGSFLLQATVQTPIVFLGNQQIFGTTYSFPLFSLPPNVLLPITIRVNGYPIASIHKFTNQTITTTLLTLTNNNSITLSNKNNGAVTKGIPLSSLLAHLPQAASITFHPLQAPMTFRVTVPKVTDSIFSFTPDVANSEVSNCSSIPNGTFSSQKTPTGLTLQSLNTDACVSYFDKDAPTSLGYAAFITSSHQRGQPLSFWAENTTDHYAFSQVSLNTDKITTTSALILPPMQANNLGYAFHFDNTSIGIPTVNTLHNFSLYPIPYTFLQSLQADSQPIHTMPVMQNVSFEHLNPSLYIASVPEVEQGTLILSAAYNPGWNAYAFSSPPNFLDMAFPFIFGTELPRHVKVNNWENGWQVNTNQAHAYAVMVFLPQYLEYVGFLFLISFFLYLLI